VQPSWVATTRCGQLSLLCERFLLQLYLAVSQNNGAALLIVRDQAHDKAHCGLPPPDCTANGPSAQVHVLALHVASAMLRYPTIRFKLVTKWPGCGYPLPTERACKQPAPFQRRCLGANCTTWQVRANARTPPIVDGGADTIMCQHSERDSRERLTNQQCRRAIATHQALRLQLQGRLSESVNVAVPVTECTPQTT
jgi:hypothetical protein